MWESVEPTIADTNLDFLVIFDSCNAGHLCQPKRGRRKYEILAACGSKQLTPRPSEESFTRALIWSLGHLSSLHYFTTTQLLDKIKTAPHYGANSDKPQLYSTRLHPESTSVDRIVISPNINESRKKFEQTIIRQCVVNINKGHFMDIRLYYDTELTDETFDQTAMAFKGAVDRGDLKTSSIHYLKDNSVRSLVEPYTTRLRALSSMRKNSNSPIEPGDQALLTNPILLGQPDIPGIEIVEEPLEYEEPLTVSALFQRRQVPQPELHSRPGEAEKETRNTPPKDKDGRDFKGKLILAFQLAQTGIILMLVMLSLTLAENRGYIMGRSGPT